MCLCVFVACDALVDGILIWVWVTVWVRRMYSLRGGVSGEESIHVRVQCFIIAAFILWLDVSKRSGVNTEYWQGVYRLVCVDVL